VSLSVTDLQLPAAPNNFAAHLFAVNASRGHKLAYVDDHGTLTYAQLAERARRVAAYLHALQVRREERVLLLMHDCNDWPQFFWAHCSRA
jgi:benzoate-CoA ligase